MQSIVSLRGPLTALVLALAAGGAYGSAGLAESGEMQDLTGVCAGGALLSIEASSDAGLEWTMGAGIHGSNEVRFHLEPLLPSSPWLEGSARCADGVVRVKLIQPAAVAAGGMKPGAKVETVQVDVSLALLDTDQTVATSAGGRVYTFQAARAG